MTMTDYVVTYVDEEGSHPLSLTVALGNDEQARQFASRTAQRVHGVTLAAVDDDGMTATMARWLNGALARNGNSPYDSLRVAAQEFVDATDETEDALSVPDDHDDEAHHFEGRCMKCKTNREFIGRVKELSNGSRQAQGTCPVCGTKMVRMVSRTTTLDEWDDEPPSADDVEAEIASAPLTDEDGTALEGSPSVTATIAEAISDATDEATIADIAEATAVAAVEFSNAAEEAETPPKPRKRAAKKANANTASDADIKRVQEMGVAHCVKCNQGNIPVMERGGLRILMLHPDPAKNLDRCPGSTTVLQG